MVRIDPTVAGYLIAGVFALVVYWLYTQWKEPKLKTTLPIGRSRPVVMTQVGLRVIKETIPLTANKYQILYEGEDGYRQTYTKLSDFDELVPIYPNQTMVGGSAPVFIEYNVLLERAYTYEDAPTRKLLKAKLAELAETFQQRGLSDEQAKEALARLHSTVKTLNEQPKMYTKLVEQLATTTDNQLKAESTALSLSAGIEGQVARRTEPFVAIATAKANRPDDRNRNAER